MSRKFSKKGEIVRGKNLSLLFVGHCGENRNLLERRSESPLLPTVSPKLSPKGQLVPYRQLLR
ncbi:hypothetical protein I309_00562 [Cryptococcus deuterogattii LA55]|nr:hypothetical protein I309_00562 [Cryptococcus deuterogattii LA55]KIR92356.1 hypothetical protein I304_03760 [Cryptococcus deuterogattii CBS 10090]